MYNTYDTEIEKKLKVKLVNIENLFKKYDYDINELIDIYNH